MARWEHLPTATLTPSALAEMRQAARGVRIEGEPIDRFLAKCVRDDETGCVLWLAHLHASGYGHFGIGRRVVSAHRFSYEHYVGPIPDGLVLDHVCRNRSCVNFQHLRVVTRRENTLAPGSLSPSKIHADKQRCNNGHPFDEQNTHVLPDGARRCKACNYAACARYRNRRKASLAEQEAS